MRCTRLIGTLVAIPLTVAACGTADPTSSALSPVGSGSRGTTSPGESSGMSSPGQGSRTTAPEESSGPPASDPHPSSPARDYAAELLRRIQLPVGARASDTAPGRYLRHLPKSGWLSSSSTVLSRFWSIDRPAADVFAWLRRHGPGLGPAETVSQPWSDDMPVDPVWSPAQFLAYQVSSPPAAIAAAELDIAVVSTGPTTSAVAGYAFATTQRTRPASEVVPLRGVTAVLGWSLAVHGTPVIKTLTGSAAADLARDFNALPVDIDGAVPCPMIPTQYGDVTVTFTAAGHIWRAEVPACPYIAVTRDGRSLPPLGFGKAFLDDLRANGVLLHPVGLPTSPGGVIPLTAVPSQR